MAHSNPGPQSSLPSLAMTAPAVRMVVIYVWPQRGPKGEWFPDDVTIYPVVSLVAKGRSSHPEAPTYEAIIHDHDVGLCEASSLLDGADGRYTMAVGPWPYEEDKERLGPLIGQLRTEARMIVDAHKEPARRH